MIFIGGYIVDKAQLGIACLGALANGWHPKKAGYEGGFIKDMKYEKAWFYGG